MLKPAPIVDLIDAIRKSKVLFVALTAELKKKGAVTEYVPSPQQFIYPMIRKAVQ